jgi:hypothetical protein
MWIGLGSAAPAHTVACGDVLGPGGAFRLEADLQCEGSFPFALTLQDGATLDLKGHTIGCPDGPQCILLRGEGAQISNGTLDVGAGFTLVLDGGHAVRTITLQGQANEGVLAVVRSHNNVLAKVTMAGSVDHPAFIITGNDNRLKNSVIACTALLAGDDCVSVSGDGNRLVGNVVTLGPSISDYTGFRIAGNNNRLKRNEVLGEGGPIASDLTGVLVSGTGNVLSSNTVLGNDLDLHDTHGDCASNTWRRNTFETSDPPCIR